MKVCQVYSKKYPLAIFSQGICHSSAVCHVEVTSVCLLKTSQLRTIKKLREIQAPAGNSTKHVSGMVQKSLHGEWFTLCSAVSQYIMGIWTIFIGLTNIPYWMFTTYSQCKFGPWQISKCKTCQRNMEQTKTSLNFSIAINYPEKQSYLNTTGSLHAIYGLEMTLQWHDLNIL